MEAAWKGDETAEREEKEHETWCWREQGTGEEEGKDSFFLAAV